MFCFFVRGLTENLALCAQHSSDHAALVEGLVPSNSRLQLVNVINSQTAQNESSSLRRVFNNLMKHLQQWYLCTVDGTRDD